MNSSGHVEVEQKFEVGIDTPVPGPEVFEPLVPDDPHVHSLSAIYFDTVDLTLTRHKITLRRRTGGDDAGWHLKLPDTGGRREFHAPLGDPGVVPTELRQRVIGLVRRQALLPVAQVANTRTVMLLRDTDERAVIEFCDDRVTAESFATGHAGESWREWEAELVDPDQEGAAGHLAALSTSLEGHGASAASHASKLARALGPLPDTLDDDVPAFVRSLQEDLDKLLVHDPGARAGMVVGIHQARVAVRGLRSTLQTFATEFGEATAGSSLDLPTLAGELKIFAAVLGSVRDIQVVSQRLRDLYGSYEEALVPPVVRERIEYELDFEEKRAQKRVVDAMESDRYLDLLDELDELVRVASEPAPVVEEPETLPSFESTSTVPPTTGSATPAPITESARADLPEGDAGAGEAAEAPAEKPAETSAPTRESKQAPKKLKPAQKKRKDVDILLRGVDRQFEKFTKVRTRTERDLDRLDLTLAQREELTHVARKRAKALRRGVNSLPKNADLEVAPLRTACQRLHTVLGDIQDSVTTRNWLRRIMLRAEAAGEPTFGFGVLYEHERGFSERSLEGFEADAAAVTAAYRELSASRKAGRKKRKKK